MIWLVPIMPKLDKHINHKSFKFVRELGGISEYVHGHNGLRVLIYEDHSAPVVALNVTYLVGSRNEAVGHTGATHLLEHLMFKGSKNFNKKNGKWIWAYIGGLGAEINGTTMGDRTNYYEVLPKEHVAKALAMEADRMVNSFISEEDRQSEMTVVRNEFEWGENEPREALGKQIWATIFQAHPYGRYVIGLKSDIENVPIERLREFYKTFYWPNNAYVTLAGDISVSEALPLIDKYFRKLKASPKPIPIMYSEEPAQEGPRRTTVRRAGELGLVAVAHRLPPALSPEMFALDVLAGILGRGRSSRMYRALVDTGLAARVSVDNTSWRDASVFATEAHLSANVDHKKIEEIILSEYEKVKKEGISKEELEREKKQIEVQLATTRDGPEAVMSVLNETIAVGDWTLYVRYQDEIKKVTLELVKAVANKYLIEDLSTTGYFIPKKL